MSSTDITQEKHDYALYWGSGSPFAWRVIVYLHEKQLTFDSHLVEFSKKEHKTEQFLKMNPRGKIPVLVDQTVTPHVFVYESLAILHYLERKHGPLYSADDLQEVSNTLVRTNEVDTYLVPVLTPLIRECWFKQEDEWNLEFATEALSKLKEELSRWEGYLNADSDSAYLNGGNSFSLVDAVAGTALMLLDRFGFEFKENGFEQLEKYVQLVKDRDSVQKSFPPHWRGTTNNKYVILKTKLNL